MVANVALWFGLCRSTAVAISVALGALAAVAGVGPKGHLEPDRRYAITLPPGAITTPRPGALRGGSHVRVKTLMKIAVVHRARSAWSFGPS